MLPYIYYLSSHVTTVSGPATVAALGNADIKDCDAYTDATHKTWKGRALLVVRSTTKSGKATVTLKANGLKSATETIVTK